MSSHWGPDAGRTGGPGWLARAGRYDSTRVARHATGPADPALTEDARRVPTDPTTSIPGRSLLSRRAIVDIVRAATLGSYGVIGLAGSGPLARFAGLLGADPRGIRVDVSDGLRVDIGIVVAHSLPIAEVARQVESAVRHAIRLAIGREVDALSIHVDGLRVAPYEVQPAGPGRRRGRSGRCSGAGRGGRPAEDLGPDDLAASGTDVA